MTIDEAIKRLTHYVVGEEGEPQPADLDAFQLGIEALKQINQYRLFRKAGHVASLPGETPQT